MGQGFGPEDNLEEQGFEEGICLNFKRASCSSILTQGRCLWGGPSIDFELTKLTTWGLPQTVVFPFRNFQGQVGLSSFELFNLIQVKEFQKKRWDSTIRRKSKKRLR